MKEITRRQFGLIAATVPVIGLNLPIQKKSAVKSYEEFCHENHHKYECTLSKATYVLTCEKAGIHEVKGRYVYYESAPCLVDVPEEHAFLERVGGNKVWGELMLIRDTCEFHYIDKNRHFNYMLCSDYLIDPSRMYCFHLLYYPYYRIKLLGHKNGKFVGSRSRTDC